MAPLGQLVSSWENAGGIAFVKEIACGKRVDFVSFYSIFFAWFIVRSNNKYRN
jgi:hypothetical protein